MRIKLIAVMVLVAGILVSCNKKTSLENQKLKDEVAILAAENQQYINKSVTASRSLESYQKMLDEINADLAAMDDKHQLIKGKGTEFKGDAETDEEIQLHLEHLQAMMENSKHKIAYMHKSLDSLRMENAGADDQIFEMELALNGMAKTVVERDAQIKDLHSQLKDQKVNIQILADAFVNQAAYSDVLTDIINTGFYTIGTTKELKAKGVIDVKGGFIGIGRVKTLDANAPDSVLTAFSIPETDMIEVNGKKVKLITTHPEGSYNIQSNPKGKNSFLNITNKGEFWKTSNYLVVEIAD
jgi:hypothetical protein